MKFEMQIVGTSRIKERNLLKPANMAMNKPDTGVEIKNKSAYYVIRDCATIANDYIPHKCYSSLSDPIGQLIGKFSVKDIQDFVSRAAEHEHTQQLLMIVFADIYKREASDWSPPVAPEPESLEIDADADHDEIYGEYGYGEDNNSTSVELPVEPPIDLGDSQEVVDKLVETFQASD